MSAVNDKKLEDQQDEMVDEVEEYVGPEHAAPEDEEEDNTEYRSLKKAPTLRRWEDKEWFNAEREKLQPKISSSDELKKALDSFKAEGGKITLCKPKLPSKPQTQRRRFKPRPIVARPMLERKLADIDDIRALNKYRKVREKQDVSMELTKLTMIPEVHNVEDSTLAFSEHLGPFWNRIRMMYWYGNLSDVMLAVLLNRAYTTQRWNFTLSAFQMFDWMKSDPNRPTRRNGYTLEQVAANLEGLCRSRWIVHAFDIPEDQGLDNQFRRHAFRLGKPFVFQFLGWKEIPLPIAPQVPDLTPRKTRTMFEQVEKMIQEEIDAQLKAEWKQALKLNEAGKYDPQANQTTPGFKQSQVFAPDKKDFNAGRASRTDVTVFGKVIKGDRMTLDLSSYQHCQALLRNYEFENEKEKFVFTLFAEGWTYEEIAKALNHKHSRYGSGKTDHTVVGDMVNRILFGKTVSEIKADEREAEKEQQEQRPKVSLKRRYGVG